MADSYGNDHKHLASIKWRNFFISEELLDSEEELCFMVFVCLLGWVGLGWVGWGGVGWLVGWLVVSQSVFR